MNNSNVTNTTRTGVVKIERKRRWRTESEEDRVGEKKRGRGDGNFGCLFIILLPIGILGKNQPFVWNMIFENNSVHSGIEINHSSSWNETLGPYSVPTGLKRKKLIKHF